MNYLDLIKAIDNKKLNSIVLVHDKEPYLTELAIESIKNDLLDASFLDLNFAKFEFEKLEKSTYLSAVETLPFMDERKVVVIDNVFLERDKLKKFENIFEFIQESFKDFNQMTILLLIFRGDNIFKTGKFYKAIDKYGQVYVIDRLDRRQFQSYIIKHFTRLGVKLDSRKSEMISDRIGYLSRDSKVSLYEVNNELDKLANNLSSANPSFEEIEEAVLKHFQDNIFHLTDALSARDVGKALTIYERMVDEDEFMIFHMILRQVKNLICVKDCDSKRINKATGMKYCMIGSYEYDKGISFGRNFSLDELLEIHKLCYKMEELTKTQGVSMKKAIKRVILSFLRRRNG